MRLTGLRANNPLGVMAAYGALRLLPGARLRWDGPHPELDWSGDPLAWLTEQLPGRLAAPELNLIDDPREITDTERYRALAEQMPSDWLLAYAAETAKGMRATGLLLMRDGRHRFIANARKIMQSLAKRDPGEGLREALFGPWRYQDQGLQAWGWDAAARIDACASTDAVTSAPKFGVLGAYWLAWESLPFWPMINGRTIGMTRDGWRYATCANWLDTATLRAIILGLDRLDRREQAALGLTLWSSERIPSGKFGRVLGWGVPLAARTSSERPRAGGFAERRKASESRVRDQQDRRAG